MGIERLDIYTQFLMPTAVTPRKHKVIETTDIMVQMVAALPRWLAEECAQNTSVAAVRLGSKGIAKQIFLGTWQADLDIDYLEGLHYYGRPIAGRLSAGSLRPGADFTSLRPSPPRSAACGAGRRSRPRKSVRPHAR